MYDLAIIGGGPAGFNAGLRAASLGLETVLIERNKLGGTCLNKGCIPTKSLLKSAEIYNDILSSENFGIIVKNVEIDLEKMYARKDKVVEKLRNGMEFLIKKSPLEVVFGEAVFTDSNTLQIRGSFIEAQNIMIACGSKPAMLNIKGAENALSSDEVLAKPIDGNEIIIIGGGVIGCEFASLYSMLGKSVTVLEYAPKLLPNMDADASGALSMALRKKGVKIFCSTKVQDIIKNVGIEIKAEVRGEEKTFFGDCVIMCVGRVPDIDTLCLENAGIKVEGKKVVTDKNCRTNISNIYCVGDAGGKMLLAHYAEAEAINVVEKIAGRKPPIDLSIVPSAVYTNPEIAVVGKTESCGEEILYTGKAFMASNGKANSEDNTGGFVKTVYNSEKIIVGGVIAGLRATELIGEIALAITNKLTFDDIIKTVHPHPTVSETLKMSAEIAKNNFK